MEKQKTYKGGWFLFWIQSSRGTNSRQHKYIAGPVTKEEIRDVLEDWCSTFGAWHVSENHVSYGFKRVSPSKLPKGLKKNAT